MENKNNNPQKKHFNFEKTGDDVYADWYNKQSLEDRKKLPSPMPSDGSIDSSYIFEISPNHSAYAYTEDNNFDEPHSGSQKLYNEDELQEVIRRIVMAMQLSENSEVLFQARCILIAFGIGDPPSETELSKVKGCSRQFVSKKVKHIQKLFNITPSQYMRSEVACKAYADAWKRSQEKKKNLYNNNKTNNNK